MKKKFWKRLISALLSTLLVVCLVSPASAKTVATGIQDEDLLINQEVAENIAELFVNDMVNSGQTEWNSSTEITDTKILYGEDGGRKSYSWRYARCCHGVVGNKQYCLLFEFKWNSLPRGRWCPGIFFWCPDSF